MLAHYPQPQHLSEHYEYSDLPSPSASLIPSFYTAAYSTSTPSPSEFKQTRLRNHYFDLTAPINTSEAYNYPVSHWDSSATQQLNHPPIRLQQATPSPGGFQDTVPAQMSVLSQAAVPLDVWEQYDGSHNQLNLSLVPRQHFGHRRASSSSSVGSVGPASPYNQTISYPRIAHSGTPSLSPPGFDACEADQAAPVDYTKPLPTPSHSPSQEFSIAPVYPNYDSSMASQMAAHIAKQQALMDQPSSADEETPAYSYSARQSVSSMGRDDPMTPPTTYAENLDDGSHGPSNGEYKLSITKRLSVEYSRLVSSLGFQSQVPNLGRTMSVIYQDELFNPASDSTTSAPVQQSRRTPTNNKALLSPYRTVFSERLQAANNSHLSARSQSPASTISRQRSPFREGSPYAASINSYGSQASPHVRLGSASQLREQRKAEADALALAQHQASEDVSTPKTISPKDALLEYHESVEDSNTPLFSQENSTMQYGSDQFTGNTNLVENTASDMDDNVTEQSYNSMVTTRRQSSSDFSTASGGPQSAPSFTFVPPSVPGGVHMPQQYPFIAQQQRRQQSLRRASDSIPEFPAHLTSMESSASDAGVTDPAKEIKRPTNTMADSGTYTCTYHGCTLRFETPAKLQKHKREGHRQSTPQMAASGSHVGSAIGSGSGMTSAALMRNSQAGPHKCERINPSTNKPCNTIFSRPYDLTRHEDTIHNARKQKVRCHLCTEEKTFSRNDALTRHMRVVHPEIDFPGKTRRRNHD